MCLTNLTVFADGSYEGGSNITKIPVGARAISMGYAFTAVADDGFALFSNPAGIGNLSFMNVAIGYQKQPFDQHIGAFAFSLPPMSEDSHFGIGIGGVGELINKGLEQRDATGTLSTEKIKNQSYMGILSLAYRISAIKGTKLGISLKYIREEIGDSKANAGSIDLGTIIPLPVIDIGAVIQDLALLNKYDDRDKMKFGNPTVKIGLATNDDVPWGRISVEMQKNIKTNDPVAFYVGGSFYLFKHVKQDTGLPSEIFDKLDMEKNKKANKKSGVGEFGDDVEEFDDDFVEPEVKKVKDIDKKKVASEVVHHALLLNVGFKRDSFTGGITYKFSFFSVDVATVFPSTFNKDFNMLGSVNLLF